MTSWTYRQSTGELIDPDGIMIEVGYSGAPGYVNRPIGERVEDHGVIPTGNYTMMAAIDHATCGPCSIPLTPDADNAMHGRDGFYMHGDTDEMNQTASSGCIIMSRPTRDMVNASPMRTLCVVV